MQIYFFNAQQHFLLPPFRTNIHTKKYEERYIYFLDGLDERIPLK